MPLRKAAYRQYVLLRQRLLGTPAVGRANLGDLRSVEPVGRHFGTDRGDPVDRYYIEQFLARHATDVRGQVLEIGEDLYTRRYGGSAVTGSDVLHVRPGNPRATIVADLADAPGIPDGRFDCIILTQTLHLIYEARRAVATLHRILRPGGVLLMTVPGITPVPTRTTWGYTWYWAFTALAVERMLGEVFDPADVTVETTGNVLAATAFLQGLAWQELTPQELDAVDPDFPVILSARARRRTASH
jgi:SAM-dependent methyltransferase